MAQYALSSQKLRNQGKSGGLRADMINAKAGGSLATARIDANAGRIKFMPANVPKEVVNQTSAGLQHFMGTTAEAAFKYQDRESTFYANQAEIEYLQRSGDAQTRFSEVKGAQTKQGYEVLQQELDESFNMVMGKLDPRTQQKAVNRMMAIKQRARMQGATHRATEFDAAVEQQKSVLSSAYTAAWQDNPTLIFTKDANGMTGKEHYFNIYPEDHEKAVDSFTTALLETGKGLYFNEDDPMVGIAKAEAFFNSEAGRELTSRPGKRNQAFSFVDTKKVQVTARAESARKAKVDKDKLFIEEEQNAARVMLYQSEESGELIPEAVLNDLVLSDTLKASDRNAYVNEHYRGYNAFNVETFDEMLAIANDPRLTKADGFSAPWHARENNDMLWSKRMELDSAMKLAQNYDKNGEFGRVMDSVEEGIVQGTMINFIRDPQNEAYINSARQYIRTRFEAGDPAAEIERDALAKFNISSLTYQTLPPLSSASDTGIFKPDSGPAAKAHMLKIDSHPTWTAGQKKFEKEATTKWINHYSTKEAAEAEQEVKAEEAAAAPKVIETDVAKMARHAEVDAQTELMIPEGFTPEQIEEYKIQARFFSDRAMKAEETAEKERARVKAQRAATRKEQRRLENEREKYRPAITRDNFAEFQKLQQQYDEASLMQPVPEDNEEF